MEGAQETVGMFPAWSWVLGLFIGASIGSFLNVVIYRMPRGLSVKDPKHSFCPSCRTQLGVRDLFPLLSWLGSRGRCQHCGNRISPRYFVVELITGGLFAGFWYQNFVAGWDPARAIFLSLFAAGLVAAIFIDLEFYIIPDQVNAWLLLCGLGYNGVLLAQGDPRAWTWGIPSALAGWIVGVGVLWFIALLGRLMFGKDAMGHGDIKMTRGIGAMLFPLLAGVSFALAVALGAVIGLVQILARGRHAASGGDEEEDEPYVPESVGSLFKSGIGYLLCLDVIGLAFPKFYESWFGENPYSMESVEDEASEISFTMIPFGPYLAAGALISALMEPMFMEWVNRYWSFVTGAS